MVLSNHLHVLEVIFFCTSYFYHHLCRTSDNMREEREHLLKVVEAKTEALEEMKVSHDALSKKMKLREKRIKDLEEERIKVMNMCVCVREREIMLCLCIYGCV